MRAYPVETVELESEALGYVNNGNLTDDGTNLYEWDELNRLVRLRDRSSNDELAEYSYDAMNRRIVKHLDTTSDGFVNSSDDRLGMYHCGQTICEERGGNDGSGSVVRSYIHGMNYIDEVIAFSTDSSSVQHVYLSDLRYSVYGFVDTAGTVEERYVYNAYGKRTVMDASFVVRANAQIDQRFGYTGQELDDESGNMYFNARYYSTGMGRFIGRDPLGTELEGNCPSVGINFGCVDEYVVAGVNYHDGLNLYSAWFVPNGVDPTGMWSFGIDVGKIASWILKKILKVEVKLTASVMFGKECCCKGKTYTERTIRYGGSIKLGTAGAEIQLSGSGTECGPCKNKLCARGSISQSIGKAILHTVPGGSLIPSSAFDSADIKVSGQAEYCDPGGLTGNICINLSFFWLGSARKCMDI